jgi:hypothetical protein
LGTADRTRRTGDIEAALVLLVAVVVLLFFFLIPSALDLVRLNGLVASVVVIVVVGELPVECRRGDAAVDRLGLVGNFFKAPAVSTVLERDSFFLGRFSPSKEGAATLLARRDLVVRVLPPMLLSIVAVLDALRVGTRSLFVLLLAPLEVRLDLELRVLLSSIPTLTTVRVARSLRVASGGRRMGFTLPSLDLHFFITLRLGTRGTGMLLCSLGTVGLRLSIRSPGETPMFRCWGR